MTSGGMSVADIAAVTRNNDGFENGGLWWIIVLFLLCGRGWGYGGEEGGVKDAYVLNSDFASLSRQIDSGFATQERRSDAIINGICDSAYTNAQLIAGVNQNLNTQGFETRNAITQAQIAEMQNTNALQSQIAQCCCDNRAELADIKYNMATNTCAITHAIADSTRAILDAQTQAQLEAKNEKIAEQNQQIFGYQLAASQAAQNNYLISQLRPAPVPAFQVPNPFSYNNCGCGCGC
mgnify:CR=1 FL=1